MKRKDAGEGRERNAQLDLEQVSEEKQTKNKVRTEMRKKRTRTDRETNENRPQNQAKQDLVFHKKYISYLLLYWSDHKQDKTSLWEQL
jgi:hypothetical protein